MALRLHVLSDLHLDFLPNRRRLPGLIEEMSRHPADALVVAGDLSHKTVQVEDALRALSDLAPRRLFVAGNHDVWVVKPKASDPADSWARLEALNDLAHVHGYATLERANASLGGFTFVGTMGWYDYSYASKDLGLDAVAYSKKKWNDLTYMDASYAKWGLPDAEVSARLTQRVEARLAAAEDPIVFVSHHVPLERLVLRRGHASWDFFNAYMGSRSLEECLAARGVSRFVFGHTHRPVALVEPRQFIVNNPLGYPRQALTPRQVPFLLT